MPTPKLVQITAWSFSRWSDYEKCPLLAKFKHVDKRKEPGSFAMDRGADIHKLAEKFSTGTLKELPEELNRFEQEFIQLVEAGPECEQEWAFNSNWVRTGWFDRDAWLRIKMDAAYFQDTNLFIIDHKTGKPKPEEHKMQLELYGLGGMLMFPDTKRIVAKLWYLDQGTEEVMEFKVSEKELSRLKNLWLKRTRAMLNDTVFPARPGGHCSWCWFSQRKNGPCVH